MESFTPRLPAAMGSAVAMVVAFVSFVAQVSPVTCLVRTVAAFAVFAAFGIVIQYLLAPSAEKADTEEEPSPMSNKPEGESVPPGTTVEQLLVESPEAENTAEPEPEVSR